MKDLEKRSDETVLSLKLYLADAKDPSPTVQQMAQGLPELQEILQLYILSPAQRLISYLAIDEMLTEEKADADQRQKRAAERSERRIGKIKTSEETASPVPVAQATAPTAPAPMPLDPLQTSFQQLEQRYRALLKGKNSEIGQTLLNNLPLLKNLCATVDTHGERSSFILEGNLAIAVHLEQTLTLLQTPASFQTAKSKAQDLLKSMGLEYRWNQHAPHLMLPPVPLVKHVYTFLEEREKVIAVSSRYPASGRDKLANDALRASSLDKGLPQALIEKIRERYRTATKSDLESGVEACLVLLDTFGPATSPAPMEEPLSLAELEAILTTSASIHIDESIMRTALSRFEALLTRIQKFRACRSLS